MLRAFVIFGTEADGPRIHYAFFLNKIIINLSKPQQLFVILKEYQLCEPWNALLIFAAIHKLFIERHYFKIQISNANRLIMKNIQIPLIDDSAKSNIYCHNFSFTCETCVVGTSPLYKSPA